MIGITRLSLIPNEYASARQQALAPIVICLTEKGTKYRYPIIHAVTKQARQPATEADALICGDFTDLPIHAAMGSAMERHSTAYRAISIGNRHAVRAVPSKK